MNINYYSIVNVFHVVTAVLMAWPFYALVIVNQRGVLGPPLGDRADTYMENIIKNRTIPCFIFQITALVTGLILVFMRDLNLGALVTFPALGLKFILLLFMGGSLSYVHFSLQPRIDALFGSIGELPIAPETASEINKLRVFRKKMATMCLFAVLTTIMLGVQSWQAFPLWLNVILVALIALFSYRSFKTATAYGWF